MIIMCGVIFTLQQVSTRASKTNADNIAVVDNVDKVIAELFDQNASMRGLIIYKAPKYAQKYVDAGRLLTADLNNARSLAGGDPQLKADLDELEGGVRKWQTEIGDHVIALAGAPATMAEATQIAASERASFLLSGFRTRAGQVSKRLAMKSDEAQVRQDGADTGVRNTIMFGSAVVVAVMVLAGVWLTRMIAMPVLQMTATMKRLAEGDFSAEVPLVGRTDELGRMGEAVQVFKDAGIEKLKLEGMTVEQRRQTEAERQRNEADRAKAAAHQAEVVESLATGLDRLSSGDLVFRLNTAFTPEYEKLRTDFNGAMEKLQDTLQVVSGSASAIHSGTGEISAASDDLSRRTEQQAASLEQTAAALDEITATVRKTAEGATHAQDVVALTRKNAEHSGQVVRDAVAAMNEISSSSSQVSQIIGVIDEIAFQTNLLALNAGVEAARAGDAGRGFAVVASEVRALAQRSAQAAKEIKTLISASTQQVGQGVDLVNATGKALAEMENQVTEINLVVAEIAASAREQATALHEVNTAVNQMDQVTQQNAAMVEQSTAASHSLSQEAENLSQLIGRFQVGRSDAPAQRPTIKRSAPRQTATAMKTTGAGGAARKPAATQDTWEEF
ncbi:MAG: methyl-accepting chemotaxis protein [Caulobacteraceae bacterium]